MWLAGAGNTQDVVYGTLRATRAGLCLRRQHRIGSHVSPAFKFKLPQLMKIRQQIIFLETRQEFRLGRGVQPADLIDDFLLAHVSEPLAQALSAYQGISPCPIRENLSARGRQLL